MRPAAGPGPPGAASGSRWSTSISIEHSNSSSIADTSNSSKFNIANSMNSDTANRSNSSNTANSTCSSIAKSTSRNTADNIGHTRTNISGNANAQITNANGNWEGRNGNSNLAILTQSNYAKAAAREERTGREILEICERHAYERHAYERHAGGGTAGPAAGPAAGVTMGSMGSMPDREGQHQARDAESEFGSQGKSRLMRNSANSSILNLITYLGGVRMAVLSIEYSKLL
jgi:hypothetical protein